jgi:hypothetical protein
MASRGLSVSKKQCCDILGWTSSEFDKAVRDGMPVAERPSGICQGSRQNSGR